MAVKHTRLARGVNCFRGTVREVYKTIADHASPGPVPNKGDKKKKHLPEGWVSIGYALMMMECYITRTQTLTNILKQLVEAGAVEQKTVNGRKWHRFDCAWAEAHQWDEGEIEWFRCQASTRYKTKHDALERLNANPTPTLAQAYANIPNGMNANPSPGDDTPMNPQKGDEITTPNVVINNGKRCNEEELQRKALLTTTPNITVVHPSEIVHPLGHVSAAYCDSTAASPLSTHFRSNPIADQPRQPRRSRFQQDEDEIDSVNFGDPVKDCKISEKQKPRKQSWDPSDLAEISDMLAELLYSVLPEEVQANAVNGWQRLWAGDFDELLETTTAAEIEKVIKALPQLKLGKFIVRAKVFVEKYPELLAAYKKVKKV